MNNQGGYAQFNSSPYNSYSPQYSSPYNYNPGSNNFNSGNNPSNYSQN